MATTNPTPSTYSRGPRLGLRVLVATAGILAPLSYFAGRVSASWLAHTYLAYLGSGIAVGALGTMVGIPIGLFFGSLRTPGSKPAATTSGSTATMEQSILEQLRQELTENQALFEARKGSTTMFARIDYITPYWAAVKASGRLFVLSDDILLRTIGTAYYWLDQATHLETLAYEAKYATANTAEHAVAERLITEARLLDGQIETSLSAAISAINLSSGTIAPSN